jgi:hypothetical protein
MSDPDQTVAAKVKAATDALNAAIGLAVGSGLFVRCEVTRLSTMKNEDFPVVTVRVARPL